MLNLGDSIKIPAPFHISLRCASSTKSKAIIAPEDFASDEERWRSERAAFDSPVSILTQSVLYLLVLDVGH
jgi:hypothetical protein